MTGTFWPYRSLKSDRLPAHADALRKPIVFELEPDLIAARVGQLGEPGRQPEDEQHGCVDAKRTPRIPALYLAERRARDEDALGLIVPTFAHRCDETTRAEREDFDLTHVVGKRNFFRQAYGLAVLMMEDLGAGHTDILIRA